MHNITNNIINAQDVSSGLDGSNSTLKLSPDTRLVITVGKLMIVDVLELDLMVRGVEYVTVVYHNGPNVVHHETVSLW